MAKKATKTPVSNRLEDDPRFGGGGSTQDDLYNADLFSLAPGDDLPVVGGSSASARIDYDDDSLKAGSSFGRTVGGFFSVVFRTVLYLLLFGVIGIVLVLLGQQFGVLRTEGISSAPIVDIAALPTLNFEDPNILSTLVPVSGDVMAQPTADVGVALVTVPTPEATSECPNPSEWWTTNSAGFATFVSAYAQANYGGVASVDRAALQLSRDQLASQPPASCLISAFQSTLRGMDGTLSAIDALTAQDRAAAAAADHGKYRDHAGSTQQPQRNSRARVRRYRAGIGRRGDGRDRHRQ
jgi:hypothetical protein